ncbi:hypothetical protein FQN55_004439 [Onygenales sp. PD_40]|nr:hypothetical protein FQN55_004439 [Onygenales sp. PD_40]KAK2784422.1 hypothetical protein FQN52_009003 [Onygenales sp. PD_12]KAK2786243.1 hypothetical protein FQN53_006797 [Emmonsiellopsis sp. PD_33]KAK2786844.1 hypothetical protein FQN51_003489 [Onygenales sp. PD_10]
MSPANGVAAGSHSHLEPHESALLELATSRARDIPSLSRTELQLLECYDRIYEQELELALLTQDYTEPTPEDDVEGQLEEAERKLLEARASYSVKRKAIETVLMTEPTIQSVHSVSSSPAERALLPLINRRDVLSLVYENLSRAHASTLQDIADAEIENIRGTKKNQELVQTLLALTSEEKPWREEITDPKIRSQLEALEAENKTANANWVTIKRIVSAAIVASGVDWADDEKLHDLVIDDSADEG